MGVHDLLAGLAIVAGLVGIVLVVFPGITVIVGAVVIWAIIESSLAGWVAMSMAIALGVATIALKFLFPGKKLKEVGIPTQTLLLSLGLGIVGIFVIPFVGAFVGFAAGIYLFELKRVGPSGAWPSTWAGLKAVALSVGIELVGGFLIAAAWLAAALFG